MVNANPDKIKSKNISCCYLTKLLTKIRDKMIKNKVEENTTKFIWDNLEKDGKLCQICGG
jgi:hypothetical protein